ncbi:9459_t:CDS:2, partial [Cetraspora pellucida]
MLNQDLTKLFYHERKDENIEDFLFDFEIKKDCKANENKARINKSVVGYSNRFESLAHIIKDEIEEHFPANYNKTTSLAVKIERYNKNNKFDMQRINKTLIEGTNNNIKTDIDDLTKVMKTLKISQ